MQRIAKFPVLGHGVPGIGSESTAAPIEVKMFAKDKRLLEMAPLQCPLSPSGRTQHQIVAPISERIRSHPPPEISENCFKHNDVNQVELELMITVLATETRIAD